MNNAIRNILAGIFCVCAFISCGYFNVAFSQNADNYTLIGEEVLCSNLSYSIFKRSHLFFLEPIFIPTEFRVEPDGNGYAVLITISPFPSDMLIKAREQVAQQHKVPAENITFLPVSQLSVRLQTNTGNSVAGNSPTRNMEYASLLIREYSGSQVVLRAPAESLEDAHSLRERVVNSQDVHFDVSYRLPLTAVDSRGSQILRTRAWSRSAISSYENSCSTVPCRTRLVSTNVETPVEFKPTKAAYGDVAGLWMCIAIRGETTRPTTGNYAVTEVDGNTLSNPSHTMSSHDHIHGGKCSPESDCCGGETWSSPNSKIYCTRYTAKIFDPKLCGHYSDNTCSSCTYRQYATVTKTEYYDPPGYTSSEGHRCVQVAP